MNDEVPRVPLGELLRHIEDAVGVRADQQYPNFGIYSFGRGVFPKPPISGSTSSANTLYRARTGQFVYSRLFAFEGAYGLVPDELDGAFVSNEFPLLEPASPRLRIGYLGWYFRLARTWAEVAMKATGMGSRRQRIHPEMIFAHAIPLPSPEEQDRIVATLDAAAARVAETRRLCREIDEEADALLRSAFHRIADEAPRRLMSEIAPLHRRPVAVSVVETYPQVSARSFGKGTFHREALLGAEITWEQPYRVDVGDVLLSNIKAWEGAVAVAKPEDHGRFGSHRYLTCVPKEGVATASWVTFFLLTPEGLEHLGKASPGSTDRNRTLGTKALMSIPVPLPPIESQKWFSSLQESLQTARAEAAGIVAEAEAVMPAILDRAFKGELSTAAVFASPASVSADATPMIAGRIAEHADTAPMFAGTASALSSVGAALADTAHMSAITAPAHASTTAGKPGTSAHPARSMRADTVHTWNIADFAAIQAAIVYRERDNPTLGTKKLYKLGYLTAAAVGARLVPSPLKMPAGPFNTEAQSSVEALAAQHGWFTHPGRQVGSDPAAHYRPGTSNAEACAIAKRLLAENDTVFEQIMSKAKDWNSKQAELYATTHAAWNDLVAAGETITDAAVISRFYEWSEEKTKFSESDIRGAMATLRSIGLQPTGGGPLCVGAGEPRLFSNPPAQS